jgi:hypothetical protein
MEYPSVQNNFLASHIAVLDDNFRRLLGKSLFPNEIDSKELGNAAFHAPFVLLSHDTAADPVFNYANLKGLELFEYTWEELMQTPSRLSAEAIHRSERDKLLSEVSRKGYLENYQGVRIAKSGRRFLIKNAVVWNLIDECGDYAGQAAKFEEWCFL